MISHEQELALRAKYNPEGSPTRCLQLILLEILKEFDHICISNGIKYWLDGGSCLGAVRHKGFIPWDDDIDVCMFQEDYDHFIRVFHEDEKYVLTTRENDLYYTNGFAKMRIKHMELSERGTQADIHYRHKGPFIDIFIVDDTTLLSAKIFKQIGCHLHIFTKIRKPGIISTTLLKICKHIYLHSIKIWTPVMKRLPWAKCRYRLGIPFYQNVFPSGLFERLIRVPFEDLSLPIPADFDRYLSDYYGDYLQLPSEDIIAKSIHFTRE